MTNDSANDPMADYVVQVTATLKAMPVCECGHGADCHWHCGDPLKPSVHECAARTDDGKWRCSCDGYHANTSSESGQPKK